MLLLGSLKKAEFHACKSEKKSSEYPRKIRAWQHTRKIWVDFTGYFSGCRLNGRLLQIVPVFLNQMLGVETRQYFLTTFCMLQIQFRCFAVTSFCRFESRSYLAPSSGQIIICRADSWRRLHAAPQLSALQMIIWLLNGANTADS